MRSWCGRGKISYFPNQMGEAGQCEIMNDPSWAVMPDAKWRDELQVWPSKDGAGLQPISRLSWGASCPVRESAREQLSWRALASSVRAFSLQALTCSRAQKNRGRGFRSTRAWRSSDMWLWTTSRSSRSGYVALLWLIVFCFLPREQSDGCSCLQTRSLGHWKGTDVY